MLTLPVLIQKSAAVVDCRKRLQLLLDQAADRGILDALRQIIDGQLPREKTRKSRALLIPLIYLAHLDLQQCRDHIQRVKKTLAVPARAKRSTDNQILQRQKRVAPISKYIAKNQFFILILIFFSLFAFSLILFSLCCFL